MKHVDVDVDVTLLDRALEEASPCVTGCDGVDADSVAGPLDGEDLRHRDDRRLSRAVRQAHRKGDDSVQRGNVNNHSSSSGPQRLAEFAAAQENAGRHHIERGLPVLQRIGHARPESPNATVVDEDVDPTEVRRDALGRIDDLGLAGDVHLVEARVGAGIAEPPLCLGPRVEPTAA